MPTFMGIDLDYMRDVATGKKEHDFSNGYNSPEQKKMRDAANQWQDGMGWARGLGAAMSFGASEAAYQAADRSFGNPDYRGAFIEAGQGKQARQENMMAVLNGGGQVGQGGSMGGIAQGGMDINAGGITGFFGGEKNYPIYVGSPIGDPNYAANRGQVGSEIGRIANRGLISSPIGATIDQTQQAQFRDQQLALGNALMAQANGQGPSLAGSQLRQSTEMNLQAAMAQAASARGGNLGAAQYQLGNARANIQQQAAMQLAQARIQEQMAARSQLGQVLDSGRGADIGLAMNQAQMNQQNNQFGAGFQATQQAAQDESIQRLMAMGYSLDQANYMAQVQQQQYSLGSLAQQTAAGQGISVQNGAQGMQMGGALVGAAGAAMSGGSSALAAYGASQALKK